MLQLATADKVDLSQLGNVPDMSDMSSCVHPSLSLFISLSLSLCCLLFCQPFEYDICISVLVKQVPAAEQQQQQQQQLKKTRCHTQLSCERVCVWTFRQVRKIGICNIIHKFAQRNKIHVSHVGNSCRTLASVRDSSLGSKVNLNTSKVVTFWVPTTKGDNIKAIRIHMQNSAKLHSLCETKLEFMLHKQHQKSWKHLLYWINSETQSNLACYMYKGNCRLHLLYQKEKLTSVLYLCSLLYLPIVPMLVIDNAEELNAILYIFNFISHFDCHCWVKYFHKAKLLFT